MTVGISTVCHGCAPWRPPGARIAAAEWDQIVRVYPVEVDERTCRHCGRTLPWWHFDLKAEDTQ